MAGPPPIAPILPLSGTFKVQAFALPVVFENCFESWVYAICKLKTNWHRWAATLEVAGSSSPGNSDPLFPQGASLAVMAETVGKGIEVSIDDEALSITANEEVVLSANVFHIAKLLKLSNVVESSRVSFIESTRVIENATVGENMQNHIMCIRTFELDHGLNIGDGIQ